jgi:cytochrome P450
MFPMSSILFPKLRQARETVAAVMIKYMRNGGYKIASGLVRMRYEHHHGQFGLNLEDVARGELGNTFAVLGNTTPCAFWILYHIFSDDKVLADVRREISTLVHEENEKEGGITHSIDLAAIQTSCPILMSTFQETMRFRAVNPGPRVLLEDVRLDDRYLLKKGSMLMIPATVQHSDVAAWGDDVGEFDHMRFVVCTCKKKPNRVAFSVFGGGHILCPGRHFASNEILVFAALMVLRFDIVPVGGKWIEPVCDNTPAQSGFPVPDEDIEIELCPRDASTKWNMTFSESGKAMDVVVEDDILSEGTAL